MQNDYYVFEDKKYEAAVRNLKATFFDIVFREEAMLKNLEQRIGTEQNDVVRQQMLDLWTKQNESLDQTLGLVENLTNSVKVLDTFISELSSIDEKIVQDIINSANHYAENPKYQEQISEEVPTQEVPMEEPVMEEVPQNVEEIPEEPQTGPVEEVAEPQIVSEEPVMMDVNQEVFGDNTDIDANNEFDISPNSDDAFEPIEEAPVNGEPTDEPVIIASESPSDVPEMEIVNEENDGTDLPYIVEPDSIEKEEEPVEEVTLNDETVEIPSYDPESVSEEEKEETEDTSVEGGPLIPMEEEPSEEPEENSSDSLIPDISIGDTDDSKTDEDATESTDLVIPGEEEGASSEEETSSDESTDIGLDLPFATDDMDSDSDGTEEDSGSGDLLIPVADQEEVPSESENSDIPRLEKILRSNKDVQIKAIIVNSAQFNKLASSFGTQEALLFARGVLSEDIYKHSNSVLTTLVKSGGVNMNFRKKEDDKEKQLRDSTATVIQEMLDKANQLYKTGKTEEAQKMYDAISEMSKTLQIEQKEEEATPTAPAPAPAQPAVAAQPQVAQVPVAQAPVVPTAPVQQPATVPAAQ